MHSKFRVFRNLGQGLVLSAMTLSSVGCSYFFKDTPKNPPPVEVKAAEDAGACLTGSVEVMARYLKKDVDRKQANEVVDCAARSITLFTDNTRGAVDGVYTQEELRNFIQTYFTKGRPLDPDLMPVLMKLKASLFGGSATSVTRSELEEIKKLVESFKEISAELDPYRDIYSLTARIDRDDPAQMDRLSAALDKLVRVAEKFGRRFAGVDRKSFSMKDFSELLRLGSSLSGRLGDLERYTDLAGSLKSVLIRPPRNEIAPGDWPLVIEKSARAYAFYLRYRYSLEKSSIMNPRDLREYEIVSRQVADIFKAAIAMHEGGVISVEEWDGVIDSLEALEALPLKLRATSLKDFLRPLFTKVLKPGVVNAQASSGVPAIGLTSSGVAVFEAEFMNWIAGQRAVLSATSSNRDLERTVPLKDIIRTLSAPVEGDLKNDPTLQTPVKLAAARARRELLDLLMEGRVLSWDKENRLVVTPRSESAMLSGRDLVVLNAVRAGVGVVLGAYAHDSKRASELLGITEAEEQEFYLDVRNVGIDIGLLDPRVRNAGARSFMEANIFTSVADANSLVGLHEGVEFFSLILSGGRLANHISNEASKECGTGEYDIFGAQKLGIDCFRRHFRENFSAYFANMPGMVVYAQALQSDDKLWAEFESALETASRPSGVSSESIENADLRTMMPILHYTESLIVNFDRNTNGQLDTAEIWAGFPLFREFIRRMAQGKAEEEDAQKTVFSYLITFGKPPSVGFMNKAGLIGWHLIGKRLWPEKASRLDVVKVIASLNVFGRTTRLGKIAEFYKLHGEIALERAFRSGDSKILGEALTLFGCPDEAQGDFERVAKSHSKAIFASELGQSMTSEKFTANMSREIKADQALARVCQPLM